MPLGHSELFVLKRSAKGVRRRMENMGIIDELKSSGLLKEKRSLFGRKYKATSEGIMEIEKAKHSQDKVTRYIAQGYFDHLSLGLFERIISLEDVDKYVEGQRHLQRLILLNFLFRR